ncbi:MAG TPA: MATE family efflux transporter [Clostridiales bacterium]|nr:MATE family efflux transporter [Clostridiales bacterium]
MKKQFDKYFLKTYFTLFGVVCIQNLIVFGVNLADSVMLGRYSETAMSGVSLANQLQFLLQMLISGTANGLVVLASQYWGKKSLEPIKKIFSVAFYFALGFSLLLGAVVFFAPSGILGILSNETEIVAEGAKYIKIMAFSYAIFAVNSMLIALMRSIERVRIGFYNSVAALFVNIFLNYALIFGNFGFPELGVEGAAIATVIARCVEFIMSVIYVFFYDKRLDMRISDAFKTEKIYFKDFVKSGLPLVGSSGSWGIAMTIQTAIMGHLGAAAIGANAVAAPIAQVVTVLYSSSSNASSVLIGKTVGENDIPRVKKYAKNLQLIYLATGIISSLLLLTLRNLLIDIYDISPNTRALAYTFTTILAITIIGSSYEAPCLCGIVSGGGDTKFVLKNDLIFMWGIVLPLAALSAFVFKFPVWVTFFILKSDQILKCAVAVFKVNRFKWIKNLTHD